MANIEGEAKMAGLDEWKTNAVNRNKEDEAMVLNRIHSWMGNKDVDPRWLAIAKTHVELGFMALNRAFYEKPVVRVFRQTDNEQKDQGS